MNPATTAAANVCINAATNMDEVVLTAANGYQLGPVGSIVLLAVVGIVMVGIAVVGVAIVNDMK